EEAKSEDEEEVEEEVESETKEEDEKEASEENDKGKTFFIATLFSEGKTMKKEIPVKCDDPGPCTVTCKIRGVDIPDCLCDPRACGNVMPFEVYETLDLSPLKKSREIFTTADASII
ncbi:hypothetical protein PIB30_091985, partial [Stylosanthes scabra]|nr:hypothetical protein [Stylosanthes scabra]